MTRFVLGVPVDGIGESLSHSSKPSLPENLFGPEMRDWVIAMKDYHGPDYINFGIWASIFRDIRDKALYCVDFLGELAVSDGIERIQKLQQGEDTNLQ